MGNEGPETDSATCISGNTLCQMDIATDAESDAVLAERESGNDRFAESLMVIASLPLSDADKAEAVKRLLRGAGR